MNQFLSLPPTGANPPREAKRRLWDGNTAKHSKSFCPLFPCLSHQIPSLRGHNGAVLGLDRVKAGTDGVISGPDGVGQEPQNDRKRVMGTQGGRNGDAKEPLNDPGDVDWSRMGHFKGGGDMENKERRIAERFSRNPKDGIPRQEGR